MALTVSTAPKYTGTLRVGTGVSTPGNLQGGTGVSTPGNLQGGVSPQTTINRSQLQGGVSPQTTINGSQLQGGPAQAGGGGIVLGATSINDPGAQAAAAQAAAAERAEAARINGVRNSAGIKRSGLESGAQTSLTDNRNTYGNDSTGFVTGIRQGQNTINSGKANNALNLRRSMAAIASGVRTGLRSGSVDLANMNALDSGAADAMARAWARQGNMQAGSANNEAELKANEIAAQQENLNLQENQGLAKLRTWRGTETNRVSNKLYNDLQVLEADSAAAGAGGVVDMGVKDRLIAQASAELDAIDRATEAALAEINAWDNARVSQEAMRMEAVGQATANPFAIESVGFGKAGGPQGAAIGQYDIRPRFRDEEALPAYNPFTRDELQPGVA